MSVTDALADMTYTFTNITHNNAGHAAAGEAQLRVTVVEIGGTQVRFDFFHVGTTPMAISEVYFDNGVLLGIASIVNQPGVNFVQGANPPNLPGGASLTPAFETTAGFLAEATAPPPFRGVNPGETLGIVFNLLSGGTYQTVIDEIATGEIRIGLHVIGFGGGGSESFVNGGGNGVIPAPGAAVLGCIGLAMIGLRRRRRN